MTLASLLVSHLITSKPRAARRPTGQPIKKSPLADCLMCACRFAGRLFAPRLDTFPWFGATRLAIALAAVAYATLSLPTSPSPAAEPRTVTNSIGMKLVLIPKGQFTMGSPVEEEGSEDDETPHVVTLNADYYLGVTEVTQEQFRRVMGRNPSGYQGEKAAERNPRTGRVLRLIDTANYPVENVTWPEAVEFCRKLSAIPAEQQASRVYRLPTEAEWEYACRAGSKLAYSFGPSLEKLAEHAWFEKNAKSPQPVGTRKPNPWGLYDMHGNVWEWCADWMGDYAPAPATAPTGPQQGTDRVVRGGGWDIDADACRSAYRDGGEPATRIESLGFRVALTK
jgi:formylglycine-generating enzyme required for sulfatase activity